MLLFELFGKGQDTEKFDSGYRDRESHKFSTSTGREIVVDFIRYPDATEVIFSDDDRTKATGGGQEFEVFATVLKLMKQYTEQNPTETLTFTADNAEPSRVALYNKMVKRFVPNAMVDADKRDTTYTIPPRQKD